MPTLLVSFMVKSLYILGERGSWESDLITDRDVAIEIPSCADFASRGYPDVPPDEAISPSLVYVDSTLTQ